jgi:hypothetical protein
MIRAMHRLQITPLEYDPRLEGKWKNGRYGHLRKSSASEFVRNIICKKANTRRRGRLLKGKQGDRRFFGEAFVAASIPHRHGWFGSFKWLTSQKYDKGEDSGDSPFQRELRTALHKHITPDGLQRLRETARKAEECLGIKPALPDLWLITRDGHRFIEVKLPGDTVRDEQLAGLATLAASLRLAVPVMVEVAELFPEGKRGRKKGWDEERSKFDSFYKTLCG